MFARGISRSLPRSGALRRAMSSNAPRSSSSAQQTRIAAAAGGAALVGLLAYAASSRDTAAVEGGKAKRLSYSERMRPRGDGKISIPWPKEEPEEEEQEEAAVEEAGEPLQALEAEASQQSAFDPETNTINWDCPCLGGMADGPCGEEFKLAFSCFVFSEAEPKGIECVAKFQGMQDCFRRHPEIYAEELKDEEWEEAERDGAAPETGSDLSAAAPGTQEHSD
ncbi:hypothetical protein FA09DRAFT_331169 [Tilletiopsis washingtonensis]|uniref:Mitochondrial intermembrane space import and assembly protein 40 n=1 Tax=Tilletiopsis washingtonensis TaxID=58919 RepID=A0A316Z945_9BASI|nr:hypothetical protein FA09DRAFT_331169 [Tilletiopsis washingtonensis]PWN96693.1 hypothetical protein FA09DRAFT_331169 [Tilletiopsis washingtonensis]